MAARCVYRARYFNTVAGPLRRRLGVHDPFGPHRLGEQAVEPIRAGPAAPARPGKRSRPRSKAARSPAEELAPEHAAEDADRQEEVVAAGDPTAPVGREPAAGDDAMDVRVQREVLAPGVQHRQHADLGPEVLRVRRPPRAGSPRRPASAGRRPRGGCASAIGPRAPGSVNTTWKYGVSSRSAAWASSHRAAAVAWHLGQWRLPHELYETSWCPHSGHSRTCPPRAAVRQAVRSSRARRCSGVRPAPYRSQERVATAPDDLGHFEPRSGHGWASPPGGASSPSNGLRVDFSAAVVMWR